MAVIPGAALLVQLALSTSPPAAPMIGSELDCNLVWYSLTGQKPNYEMLTLSVDSSPSYESNPFKRKALVDELIPKVKAREAELRGASSYEATLRRKLGEYDFKNHGFVTSLGADNEESFHDDLPYSFACRFVFTNAREFTYLHAVESDAEALVAEHTDFGEPKIEAAIAFRAVKATVEREPGEIRVSGGPGPGRRVVFAQLTSVEYRGESKGFPGGARPRRK